jgi:LysM repeat protein
MPGVVVRQAVGAANRDYRMTISTEDGSQVFGVPFAPRGIDYGGLAGSWVEVARPADQPILAESGEPLATIAFELVLARLDDASIESRLDSLRRLAARKDRLVVSYGPSEAGLWHLTELTVRSLERTPADEINKATASLTFTEVSDYDVNVSPLAGGHVSGGKKIPATYKVKKGDTLHKIANRFYGDPKWWRAIADANKIKKPRKDAKLKPGRVIKLPRRGDEKSKQKKGKGK